MWFVGICVACVGFPLILILRVELQRPFMSALGRLLETSPPDLRSLAIVVVVLIVGAGVMFFINGAFVFLRELSGYSSRRTGTILSWAWSKVCDARREKRSMKNAECELENHEEGKLE